MLSRCTSIVLLDRLKYIEGPEENTNELFNLENDPGELNNIYDVSKDKAALLASNLNKWRQTCSSAGPADTKIRQEDLEVLKSLGYVE